MNRKINFFEKLLLPVGAVVTFFGFYLILLADNSESVYVWMRVLGVFSWMTILFIVIITSLLENMKEELVNIQKEATAEVRILKDIAHEQLQEIKLLKEALKKK